MVIQRSATMKQFFFIIIMKLILLHVNGHTAVRPDMACVPLGKSLVKSGLDLGDRGMSS